MPSFYIRKTIESVFGGATKKPFNAVIVRDERQIRKRNLVSDEPLLAL